MDIDGSRGEGGGQILRSAVSLSCITKIPVRIENIRHNRRVPGLAAQHLMGIEILSELFDAKTSGAKIGSTQIEFAPNDIQDIRIQKDAKTAASISLILQAVIFAATSTKKEINLTIGGGTDVPWSPTANYTKFVLAGALEQFGMMYNMDIKRRGYYPRGQGIVDITIKPHTISNAVLLTGHGTKEATMLCSFSKIDAKKIESACAGIANLLQNKGYKVNQQIIQEDAKDAGASIVLYNQSKNSIRGADSLWNLKKEKFDKEIVNDFVSGLGVDQNLADMLVIAASQSKGTTVFTVNKITKHLETNLYVTSKITGCKYGIGKVDGGFEVRIKGL